MKQYIDQEDIRQFSDFSEVYRFLRKLLAIGLTLYLIYLGL